MRPVSDGFLLNMAEVSGTLIGLFFVGVFFYVETGFRGIDRERDVVERYFRAGTRIVLILFAIPLGLSLTLVILEPIWNTVLFDTAVRIRTVSRISPSTALVVNEVMGTVGVVVLVSVPWILGGLHPTWEDLMWAILLAFASGFISISALVLSVFDIARVQSRRQDGGDAT
jgi:hypothetical protein